MKKRIISAFLIAGMILGVMTGCGKGDGSKSKNSNGKTTLTVGIPQNANVTDYDDNALTRYIEDSLDIDIEFVYFSSSSSEYTQQLTLMVSGGEELPDVLLGFWGMNSYTANAFGEDGYFVELSDLVEKYGTNYKAMYDTLSESDQQLLDTKTKSTVDGGWYGMPMYTRDDYTGMDNIEQMVFINQTWLDNLGLKMPTTVDELYNVCQAFATQDPNGNGIQDEIPILGASGIEYDITSYLINAFVYYDIKYPFNVTDGKVWDPASSDEYRKALIYANKMCKDGLLSDMCYTMSSASEFKSMLSPVDNVARVGIWCGHPSVYTSDDTELLDQYVAVTPLVDETGKGGYTVVRPNDFWLASFITKDCENLETAMKLLDFFYCDETITRVRRGELGVDWMDVEGVNSYGTSSHCQVVNDNAFFSGNTTWCLNVAGVLSAYNYSSNAAEDTETGKVAEVSRLAKELYDNIENGKRPTEKLDRVNYTQEEYEERSQYSTTYNEYVVAQRALFVTGSLDPNSNSDWNAYLSESKNLGQETLIRIGQNAYDRTK